MHAYINAAARPRSGISPLPGEHGQVDPTTPTFDPATEGKEPGVAPQLKGKDINDLDIVTPHDIDTLERALAAAG